MKNSENEIQYSEQFKARLDVARVVYVDVDGTLLIWPEPTPGVRKGGVEPAFNSNLISVLIHWKQTFKNRELVVWSANGSDYARKACVGCGLTGFVDACISKPHVFIDDSWAWFNARFAFDQNTNLVNASVLIDGLPPKRADVK